MTDAHPANRVAAPIRVAPIRVVIVEDSPTMRAILKTRL